MIENDAQMAKLVDALPSGGSVRKDVLVRIQFWAQWKERRAESGERSVLFLRFLSPLCFSLILISFGYDSGHFNCAHLRVSCVAKLQIMITLPSDIEISQSATIRPIKGIAKKLGIHEEDLEQYGRYKAKLPLSLIDEEKIKPHHLILVTAATSGKFRSAFLTPP